MGLELFLGQICESVDALGVALSLLPVVLFDELNISEEYESAISLFFLRGAYSCLNYSKSWFFPSEVTSTTTTVARARRTNPASQVLFISNDIKSIKLYRNLNISNGLIKINKGLRYSIRALVVLFFLRFNYYSFSILKRFDK